MLPRFYTMIGMKIFGRLADGSWQWYRTVHEYDLDYDNKRKHLEDEIVDEMYRLDNMHEIDDLHNDFIYA